MSRRKQPMTGTVDELLSRLRASVSEYEAEYGEITAAEMAAQADADDKRAAVVHVE